MARKLATQLMLLCGVLGPVFFTAVFLIEGAVRPGYDAWQTTISTLSLGPGAGSKAPTSASSGFQ